MTETDREHCKISKKEDACFETVSQWDAERSITIWFTLKIKIKSVLVWFLFWLQFFILGKPQIGGKTKISLWKSVLVWKSWHLKKLVVDHLISWILCYHIKIHTYVAFDGYQINVTNILYTVQANFKLTVFAENSRLFPFLSHLMQNSHTIWWYKCCNTIYSHHAYLQLEAKVPDSYL